MYQRFIRPILFSLPPETAHMLALSLSALVGNFSPLRRWVKFIFAPQNSMPVNLFGLTFPNPLGLAAGYDKDAQAVHGLAALGFGHIEVGTITPQPQPGNPRPRIFRLVKDQALINRMGFPGQGSGACSRRLSKLTPSKTILGINIGKNKDTPLNQAGKDYSFLIDNLSIYADYFAINISSPNTLGLRELQHGSYLSELLHEIIETRKSQSSRIGKSLPLLVKLSPDMELQALDHTLEIILSSKIDGIIATNTTISRENLRSPLSNETGGLSGNPLKGSSTRVIAHIRKQTGGKIPIVGVGGISSPQDAQEKLDAGASLVQIYTGLIYQGPGLVRKILHGLRPGSIAGI